MEQVCNNFKASKFNIFFTHEGKCVGFNSYTNEFILIDDLLFELYEVSCRTNDFDELEKIHPEFYAFLIQQGFLVEKNLDEFNIVKEESIKIDNNDSEFHLIVNPTMNCNFKCWYCYETHIKDSKMDDTTILAVISLISNVLKNQKRLKNFSMSFFGGEPLLYFHKVIVPILTKANLLCHENSVGFSCGMTTNGLLITKEVVDICKKNNLTDFQITLDGNREQHNKIRYISEGKGSYDKIINNILLIIKNGLYANIRINCSVDTMNNIDEIMNEFDGLSTDEKKFLKFDFHKVWQVHDKIEDIISSKRFFFRENGYAVRGDIIDTVRNSCYADKRYQATINYNGEVFKCTARDFTNNSGSGILTESGNIIWNERYEQRLNSKFKNEPCKECKILPLCGGGCSQQAIEAGEKDYCVMGFDEDAKKQLIINKFKALIS